MYIGNTPAENYASFLTETFTVSATTNYTLSHAVTNENDIRLVINGVVQQPGSGKAYTASGVNLVLSSATVSGDVMYAVYLGRALQTVNPPNASVGTAQLADDAVSSAKIASGVLPTNSPAFKVYLGSNQTVSNTADTRINLNTEVYDTDNAYDNSSNYRFTVPSGKGGKYYFGYQVWYFDANAGTSNFGDVSLRINGTADATTAIRKYGAFTNHNLSFAGNTTLNLNAGDYVELWSYTQFGSGTNTIKANNTAFQGFKIIT
ncbi:hypothetical protein N9S53_00445 [Candidatus Pelagibacter sp.]|nr:hypothetical protein [Candidatus Pelagibacter sp.]